MGAIMKDHFMDAIIKCDLDVYAAFCFRIPACGCRPAVQIEKQRWL